MPNCRFIISGMQRSGTTLLANRLAESTRLVYLHEPFNPLYGLISEHAIDLASRTNAYFCPREIFGLSWQRPNKRFLSRPAILSKIIATMDLDFFIKDPFWYFYHESVQLDALRFFIFKSVDAFLASNLSRGFTFRPLILETLSQGILHEAAHQLDDAALVLTVYSHLAERALSDPHTVFLTHSSENLKHALHFIPKERTDWQIAGTLAKRINGWGRGMMHTGRTFEPSIASRSSKFEIPKDARIQEEYARSLEARMLCASKLN